MTLIDHIQLIETVATENVPDEILDKFAPTTKRLRISDLFTDIVIPRTVAREVEAEMVKRNYKWDCRMDERPEYVQKVFRNRYVDFLIKHPEVQEQLGVTWREIEVLSYMDQPLRLYKGRTEAGRYRGALFATDEDICYLMKQGIQLRNIHEIDSIGENWKLLKSEGSPSFEFFPGLVPEALVGIIKIAMERGSARIIQDD